MAVKPYSGAYINKGVRRVIITLSSSLAARAKKKAGQGDDNFKAAATTITNLVAKVKLKIKGEHFIY